MVRAPCEVKCFVPLNCEHPTLRNSHLRYFSPSCIDVLSNASSSVWCSSSSLSLPAHIPRTRTLTHLPAANLHIARTINFTCLGRPTLTDLRSDPATLITSASFGATNYLVILCAPNLDTPPSTCPQQCHSQIFRPRFLHPRNPL